MIRNSHKNKTLNIGTKIKILNEVDKNRKKSEVAKAYNIPPSTLSTIIRNKEKITKAAFLGNGNTRKKRIRRAHFVEIENKLLEWVNEKKKENIHVSGVPLQRRANEVGKELGFESFKCSNGWLYRFQQKHGITGHNPISEVLKTSNEDMDNWLYNFDKIRTEFATKDIFNLCKSEIYLNISPDFNFTIGDKKYMLDSILRQKLTFLFACNSDGSEKLPILVIGDTEDTECLKLIDKSIFPFEYMYHKTSHLNDMLLQCWLLKFNNRMATVNRHVLLTFNDSVPHKFIELSNVEIEILPACMKNRLQPLHQGIVARVRRSFQERVANYISKNQQFNQSNTMVALIRNMAFSWHSVPKDYIEKCFIRAWTKHDIHMSQLELEIDEKEWAEFQDGSEDQNNCSLQPPDTQDIEQNLNNVLASCDENFVDHRLPSEHEVKAALETLHNFAASIDVSKEFIKSLEIISSECMGHMKNSV